VECRLPYRYKHTYIPGSWCDKIWPTSWWYRHGCSIFEDSMVIWTSQAVGKAFDLSITFPGIILHASVDPIDVAYGEMSLYPHPANWRTLSLFVLDTITIYFWILWYYQSGLFYGMIRITASHVSPNENALEGISMHTLTFGTYDRIITLFTRDGVSLKAIINKS